MLTQEKKRTEFERIREFLAQVEIAAEVADKGKLFDDTVLLVSLPTAEEFPEDHELTEEELHLAVGYLVELDEFISYIDNPPELTDERNAVIEKDRKELAGSFCRACGYCLPCPSGIEINLCARMSLLLRRMPPDDFLTEEGQAKMKKIEDCVHCGQCRAKCPYGLDTPTLLEENYKDYKEVLAGKTVRN